MKKFDGFKIKNGNDSRVFNFGDSLDKVVGCYKELGIDVDDSDTEPELRSKLHMVNGEDDNEYSLYIPGKNVLSLTGSKLSSMFNLVRSLDDVFELDLIIDGKDTTISMDELTSICTEVSPVKLGIDANYSLFYTYLESDFGKIVLWYEGNCGIWEECSESVVNIATMEEFKRLSTVSYVNNTPIDIKDFMEGLYD